mgnify:CR=1 FL=1
MFYWILGRWKQKYGLSSRRGNISYWLSGIDLFVENNAILLGSENEEDYPLIDILPSYGTGRDVESELRYRPLIFGENLTNIAVSGDGVIDGNGGLWWKKHFKRELEWSRPRMIEFMYSSNIVIQDLTLQNSAFWTGKEESYLYCY